MIANFKEWLVNPAAKRYVAMTAIFTIVSLTLTIFEVSSWWVWIGFILLWFWAEDELVKGTALSVKQRIMIMMGLLLLDFIVIGLLIILFEPY